MPKKILIIEDEPGILLSLKDEFESQGYVVCEAEDGGKGLELAKQQKPDLIILDIMLPVLDGYDVCKKLRMEGDTTPIIMLTVKDKEVDKVLGLELGADDYVTKPFSFAELNARVKAVFRRTEERAADLTRYRFGAIELDFEKYEAKKEGKELDLTPLEFHMLKFFVQNKGKVITRDDFLDRIWGEDNVSVSFRTVDSHIANIRKKIEEDPSNPKHILSIRGVGYKFVD
ncbi:MAG: response regulator transcription factor [Candidatus Aminicenantes bacterium]|nr:response regulator transcription factor [Candidatus Aminicenantes bacterium]MDH5384825.1 response regulator transcription factor [Candidatus Aminicenantes bacterium]MDH5743744.1 response regulator transcription factor [Candidatus Aminicenantes bacterium]